MQLEHKINYIFSKILQKKQVSVQPHLFN